MSMFMASMAKELRETGQLAGLSGMSAAGWKSEIREYEAKLEADRLARQFQLPKDQTNDQ